MEPTEAQIEAVISALWDSEDTGRTYSQIAAAAIAAYEATPEMVALRGIRAKYHELLYGVSRKYSEESRHETALRYILEAERRDHSQTGQVVQS